MWDNTKRYGRLTSVSELKEDYYDIYEDLEDSPTTDLLCKIRHDLVSRYCAGLDILDFGIGNGAFIERDPFLRGILGFDVDVKSIALLKRTGLWKDFYDLDSINPEVITFWDSLEHLPNIDEVLSLCPKFVVCSLPIFYERAEVFASKHFKPNEHIWYFSPTGLIEFMRERGFMCHWHGDLEGLAGRQGIFSFVFERK
tara:strand:- start:14332 stop:14925 length:594 start_codon:yes stop_codon:yes gene_type:complete